MELIFSLEDIHQAAKKLRPLAEACKVIAFHGEMGAGKTTFIYALCKEMGVRDVVSSPTFSLINHYQTGKGQTIYHLDLYRVGNQHEAIQAGIEDCLYSDNLCLVEWPGKIPGLFPDHTLHLTISIIDTNTRKLKINM